MAQVIPIGQPANDAERQAIAYLRDRLLSDYRVIHNFELKQGSKWFEIGLAVIAPHALYAVDVRATAGVIHVADGKWQPEGSVPFESPIPKLVYCAELLKNAIADASAGAGALRVAATVLLATNGAYLNDPGGRERERVIQLNGCEAYFTDASRLTPEASFVGDGYVLVTDDVPGTSLRVKLKKTNEPLTIDQKLRIIRDVLGALAHCHVHEVIHRAISPATVILGPEGQTRLTDFDFARPGAPREQTVAQELLTQLDEAYLAPEVFVDPIKSNAASDVFAAGVTIYELLTGDKSWKSATEAFSAKCLFPQPVSKVVPGFPEGFDA